VDTGAILFFAVGITVLLPLGARIAGNQYLARRLDLLPRFSFGTVCLAIALQRDARFFWTDQMHRIVGPAPEASGRVFFGAIGLFLFVTGVRILIKKDFDRPNADE
jgi:hypothetical protein